jgi:hypothetical protein
VFRKVIRGFGGASNILLLTLIAYKTGSFTILHYTMFHFMHLNCKFHSKNVKILSMAFLERKGNVAKLFS